MARNSKKLVRKDSNDSYLGLVRALPLRPIRSGVELDRAIAMIDSLIIRVELDSGEEDYLEVLSDLVHRYEAEHDPITPVSDAEMIRFLLESNEMTQAELAHRSKIADSTISEILAEKRKLSRRHIAAVSRVFRVSPAVFFSEAIEMTPERATKIISRRTGMKISPEVLVSLASAFALDPDRGCWRALQELVAGERPGTPPALAAKRLNKWGDGGGDCWRPAPFHVTGADIQALAECFSSEKECWRVFRELVEEAIPEMRAMQREFAEEN
jgi:HTH-type transcriptional regulator / antitoxin HigA